ncbi:MAG: class I SAM-dependent methyltransferase [Actinomycetota bacterium]
MSERIAVELGPTQETLLIPLLGRAEATTKHSGLIDDPKAVEIVEQLDYDFSKWQGARSLLGASLRTRMFDRWVETFLAESPTGTVVELGCGLNTRFERTDNGRARWFELDLPDAIELRRHFFTDADRRTMVAGSLLDDDWFEIVAATDGPWLFVAEAVLIYLDGDDVRSTMTRLADRFTPMTLAFDTADQHMVDSQGSHDAMRHMSQDSWFTWACDDPREIDHWGTGLRLIESKTFLDADATIIEQLPLPIRLATRYAPFLLRRGAAHYKLNLATNGAH